MLATFFLGLLSLAHACILPHHINPTLNTTTLPKRWFGIDHLTEETQYNRGPWPESARDDGTTPIRFCFDDQFIFVYSRIYGFYCNGRLLVAQRSEAWSVDLFGLSERLLRRPSLEANDEFAFPGRS